MPVDASIPLSYQFPKLPTAQDVEAYKQLQYRNQLTQLQVGEAQQQAQDVNSLRQLMASPGAIGPNGLPTDETLSRAMGINPDLGLKLSSAVEEIQNRRQTMLTNSIHQRLLGLQVGEKQANTLKDLATQAQTRYQGLIDSGVPRGEAIRIVSAEKNQKLQEAKDSGLLTSEQTDVLNSSFNPEVNQAFISGYKGYTDILKQQDADRRAKVQEAREARMEETAGETPFMREAAALYGKDSPEYRQALKDRVAKESTAGGAKGQGPMGSREAVYVNRALSSAGLAVRDIANISRGPVTQTSGIFGGRGQGPSLLDATKEVLANKVTAQEAQTYNVKIAGLQRNLATLESQGLAPSGALTHQMDAIVFKEGDTELTKAYKLAEARQIVEGAMDVISSNDRASQSSKDLAAKIVSQAQEAVPFTVEDLDRFSAAGPKAKIRDFMSKPPKGGAAAGGAQGQVARPKSKAEYDALPSGTHVILPNGREGVKP